MTMTRRVALVTDTNTHLGPDLAIELARRGHDLVVGDPRNGLVSELEALGSSVEAVANVGDLADPSSIRTLMDRAMSRFGRLGQPNEVAHFCAGLLDGKANFQTGQFFPMSGGWNAT